MGFMSSDEAHIKMDGYGNLLGDCGQKISDTTCVNCKHFYIEIETDYDGHDNPCDSFETGCSLSNHWALLGSEINTVEFKEKISIAKDCKEFESL